MNHNLGRALWAAFFLGALSCSALAKDARVLLTKANLDEAYACYQEKWNDGMPFMEGGVSMPLSAGEEVSHREILMFVRYLWETRKLPSLEDLEPLLQDKNMACRVFCFGCLSAQISKLPAYSPYFPGGSEPEKIAAVRAAITKAKVD
jgi:hypothetical protein